MKIFILGLTSLFLFSCSSNNEMPTITNPTNTPNILLIIADDLGKDALMDFPKEL